MALKEAADYAILNSKTLENFYKRQIGETKDEVTDVTVEKPTLEQWVELLTGVTAEGVKVKEATDQATTAAEAAKGLADKALIFYRVVGVAQFTCDEESPYTGLVTEKVVEMLTNTKRVQSGRQDKQRQNKGGA